MDELHSYAWPVDGAKAGVVIVHGLAEHMGRYEHVAAALNRAGYAVYGRDARLHGRSRHIVLRGEVQEIIDDVAEHVLSVKASHERLFVLAHSGGTLSTIPAVAALPAGTLDGLVLSGIAIMPGPAVLESLSTGEGIAPKWVSRDPEVVKAYESDPLVFNEDIPDELMGMAIEATVRATEAIPLITVPVLLIHGGEDALCDPLGAQQAHAQLVTTDKTMKIYDGLYHEVLNEPEQDEVIADVVEWLDRHVG